jgi:NAD(P)-dependent dehydrogenase (short-subunit alcohol dehydrogenase family)
MATKSSQQRVALITGGTGGIGRAIAAAFSDGDYEIVVTGFAADECERIHSDRPDWRVRQLDVQDSAEVTTVVDDLPQLDVLVNAAGMILRDGKEHDLANFERVVAVNLTGAMRVSTACHRLLSRSGGCVLNLASMLSFFGSGYAPAYSASKGGIVQLTKSLAIAWANDGIRVNAIAPGWIKTAMTDPLVNDPHRSQTIVDRTPLGRWGDPVDVAGPALFLCSPSAGFITGAVLPVDGGYSIA